MDNIVISSERCKGCQICISACPKKLLTVSSAFNKSGYNPVEIVDTESCVSCGRCASMCPDSAITVFRKGNKIAGKPDAFFDTPTTYCPGCSHGVVQRLIGEIIDENNLRGKTIGVTPIGCSIFIYKTMDLDFVEGAHGRAPAVATGVKRSNKDKLVFSYQGDGDIAAIGLSEIMHAAIRNENITAIFVNNGNFGMTGGQAAPTTLIGQITTSTPEGKRIEDGMPVKISEIIALVSGNAYIARGTVNNPADVKKTKEYIKKAFDFQQKKGGFSLVEVLGTCPSNWKKSPVDSMEWVAGPMMKEFPIGEIKVPEEDRG